MTIVLKWLEGGAKHYKTLNEKHLLILQEHWKLGWTCTHYSFLLIFYIIHILWFFINTELSWDVSFLFKWKNFRKITREYYIFFPPLQLYHAKGGVELRDPS